MESKEKEESENSEKDKQNAEEDQLSLIIDLPTSQLSNSPTDIDTSAQETNLNNLQAVVKSLRTKGGEAIKAKDGGLQMGDTGQIMGCCLMEEEVRRRRGEEKKEEKEEEKEIPTSKANKLWKWWRNMWTAPRDIQSNDIEEKDVKHKAPDEGIRPTKD